MRAAIPLTAIAIAIMANGSVSAQDAGSADRQGGASNAPQGPTVFEREGLRTSGLMAAIDEIPADAPCPGIDMRPFGRF